jgi:hypothetical protein
MRIQSGSKEENFCRGSSKDSREGQVKANSTEGRAK